MDNGDLVPHRLCLSGLSVDLREETGRRRRPLLVVTTVRDRS
jgi:hypothetical protein